MGLPGWRYLTLFGLAKLMDHAITDNTDGGESKGKKRERNEKVFPFRTHDDDEERTRAKSKFFSQWKCRWWRMRVGLGKNLSSK